jgi:hypothetical protein
MRSPVALLNDVANVDADTELYPPFRRQASVALNEAVLHLDRATHGVEHAAELDDRPVAGGLDDAAVMGRLLGVDQVAAKPSETRECSVLVGAGKPRVAHDASHQDRGQFCGSRSWR